MGSAKDYILSLPRREREYLLDYFKNAPFWLLDSFHILRLPPKTTFVDEGADARDIFILVEGNVTAIDYRVEEIVYRHHDFTPVEVLGAMEIIGDMDTYMTTLMTITSSVILKCSRNKFEKWLLNDLHALKIQSATIERYLLQQVRKERLYLLLTEFLKREDRLTTTFQIYFWNILK